MSVITMREVPEDLKWRLKAYAAKYHMSIPELLEQLAEFCLDRMDGPP